MAEHAGSVRRREDPRLITGAGEFVDDFRVPGCLHAVMLRSPHAHARIRSIDVSAARRAPGVVGVFLASDLGSAGVAIPIYAPHPALPVACGIRPLAGERVRFVGEAVAAVIADDPYRAWDALDLIRVEYEPLPALVDMDAALAPARASSTGRSSGSRRGGSTPSSPASSVTRSTTWSWRPPGRADSSPCATISSTTWAPTRSRG